MKIIIKVSIGGLVGFFFTCQVFADVNNVFRNENFTFEYPSYWMLGKPQFPSTQVVVKPKTGEGAECSLMAKELPGTVSQADIDTYLLQKLDAAEYEASMRLQYNDVRVIETGNSIFGKLPAQVVRARYSLGSSKDKIYVHALVFTTATKGKSFVLTCGSSGSSQSISKEIFNKWLLTFNKLIATFKFI